MIDLIIYGVIVIITTSITSIGIILGIYYMFTKRKDQNSAKEKANFTLNDQKEL